MNQRGLRSLVRDYRPIRVSPRSPIRDALVGVPNLMPIQSGKDPVQLANPMSSIGWSALGSHDIPPEN